MKYSPYLLSSIFTAILFSSFLLVDGCASGEGGLLKGQALDRTWPVYVEPIQDVTSTDNEVVPQSGITLQSSLREALKNAGFVVTVTPTMHAYELSVQYTRWEDHATEWTGVPDSLAATATLKPFPYGQLVSSATIDVKSSVIAFVHEEPNRLIPDLAKAIVERVLPAK